MKKKQTIEPKVHMEVLSYEYKGITVRVRINYDNGKISLIDESGSHKRWLFAERGLEYMKGWQNILDAMKYTIGEATKKLEEDQDEKEKKTDECINRMIDITANALKGDYKLKKW